MRRIILIILALGMLFTAIYFVDYGTLREAFGSFSVVSLSLVAGLLTLGSVLKAVRWAYFLRASGLPISWKDGMTSYLAGMSLSGLPGGTLLAPRLAQEHAGVHMRQAAVGLFVSHVGDALAISVLCASTVLMTDLSRTRLLVALAGLVLANVLIAVFRSQRIWNFVDKLLSRSRFTRTWLPKEEDFRAGMIRVMRAPVITAAVGFSIAATLIYTALLVVVVEVLTMRGITPLEALAVHTFSETASMVLPVPGGFGVMETSKAQLLNALAIGWVRASFIVIALRSFELLFRTVFGTVAMLIFYNPLLRSMLQVRKRAKATLVGAWAAGRFMGRVVSFSLGIQLLLRRLRQRRERTMARAQILTRDRHERDTSGAGTGSSDSGRGTDGGPPASSSGAASPTPPSASEPRSSGS